MEESVILRKLRDLRSRFRFTQGWKIVLFSLFVGILIAALYLLFIKTTGVFLEYYQYFILPIFFAVCVGALIHALQKVSLMEVALKSDGKLQLKERLSTALEWIDDHRVRTPMFRALLRDTAKSAEEISPKKVFPLEWKPQFKRLFGATTLMVIFIYMPSFSFFVPRVDPANVKTIREEAKKIERLAKKLEKKKPRTPVSLKRFKRAEKSLKKLSADLKKSKINKKQALSKISRVREKLQDYVNRKEALSKMEKQLRRANLAGKSKSEEEEEKEFQKLSRKLQEIASKAKKGKLSDKDKQQMINELQKMKQEMEKAGMETTNIEKAIENMKQGKNKAAARNIKDAADQFQQRQKEMEDLEDLEEAAMQLDESKNNISGWKDSGKMSRRPSTKFKEGKGKGKADWGKGNTNEEVKPKDNEINRNYTKRTNEDQPTMKSIYRRLYNPEREEFKKATGKVKGKISKGPVIRSLRSRKRGAPRIGDKINTDPGDTYTNYKIKGEEAVKRERIPAKYKDLIRDYYDNIEPEKE